MILLILGFVAVKYIFNRLGEDALGIIYFTATMNSMLTAVLNMGICNTTVREVSAHFDSEPGYIKNLIRTFSLFYWCVYIFVGVVIFFFAPVLVEKWINLKTMDATTAVYVLRILGISAFTALPMSLYGSLLRGLQRMEFNNFIDVAIRGLQQFGIILVLGFGGNLLHVVYWFAICYGLGILTYFIVASYFFSVKALIPGYSSEVIKRNLSFASRMVSISITATIHTQSDRLIISKLLPISILGYYSFAYSNVSRATLLTGAVSQAAFPSFSALFKSGNRSALMSQYRKLQDLLCFGIFPILAFIPFAALPLFSYLLNKEAAQILLLPVTLLCIGFYMNGTLNVPYIFSLAVGKPDIGARQNFYALFIVLPVTVILIYAWGLTGAGLSWIFYHVFAYSYGVPRTCRECLEIRTLRWYSHVLRIFGLISLTYGTAWLVAVLNGIYSLFYLGMAYTIASIFFLIGTYFLIGNELREAAFRALRIS